MRRKISPKFHVKNGVKNGKFHANFTLLGRSAEIVKPKGPRHTKNSTRSEFTIRSEFTTRSVSEMASAKMASAIGVRIDDVGSILKFRIGFPFGENSAGFCQSVWLPESILNFRIGSVSSIGGLIAATLSADTVSEEGCFGAHGFPTHSGSCSESCSEKWVFLYGLGRPQYFQSAFVFWLVIFSMISG